MPGRFVVDSGGIVRAADVDPDYERRPEPQKTVDDVKALALGGASSTLEKRRPRRAPTLPAIAIDLEVKSARPKYSWTSRPASGPSVNRLAGEEN